MANYFKVIVRKNNKPVFDAKVQIYGYDAVRTNKDGIANVEAENKVSLYVNGNKIFEDVYWSTLTEDYLTQKGEYIVYLD